MCWSRICGFMLLLLLSACGRDDSGPAIESDTATLRPVKIFVVAAGGDGFSRQFAGVVDAERKATLSFPISGKLQQLLVREGDRVVEDQQLARLDQTDYRIVLEDRRAGYDQARADFERASKLVAAGHISRTDYDKLKAQQAKALAQLQTAQQNLDYTQLRASFAGVIARRYVENFEEVSAKQEILSLQDLSQLRVTIQVPETVMIRARRQGNSRRFSARFEAIEQDFPLELKEVATRVDDSSGTFTVSFGMPRPAEHNILPGMSAQVTVSGGDSEEQTVVYLPAHTVQQDRRGHFVYVAQPQVAGSQEAATVATAVIERRAVEVAELSAAGIGIAAGLVPGDRVVEAGISHMHEGLHVRLLAESSSEAQP